MHNSPGGLAPTASRTGVSLNTATSDARMVLDAARAAEAAGFVALWCYDHLSGSLLGGDGALDVFTTLGAIAAATATIGIGPLVVNATTRHPAQIAEAAATLQALSGGRLALGLGAGASRPSPYAAELDMFGLPHQPAADRRAVVTETIAFLRALWRGDAAFDGGRFRFAGLHGVSRATPAPPIVVGANGPRMAALAGRHADAVNLHHWEADLAGLVRVARDAATEAGNDGFRITVEGPWEPDWLDAGSATRRGLRELGVDEVMVVWQPVQGIGAIGAAAPLLAT